MITDNAGINSLGHLTFAGVDTVELAKKYGTPLYLLDEDMIRTNCRTYKTALSAAFNKSLPLFASKALSCKRVYEIVESEGLGTDVVSAGELSIALKAGFNAQNIFFHGNCKPLAEIEYAVDKGIGFFVVDNEDELCALSKIAANKGVTQKILLRLTPGIDTHTFEAVRTGQVDSKFGVAIETGQAEEFLAKALATPNVEVCGFHCHIGSQIFDSKPFIDAAVIMLDFIALAKKKLGFECKMLNLGGGYGVPYAQGDERVDIASSIKAVGKAIDNHAENLGIDVPMILMEPGRSIVAAAGMTLYTVGAVKEIPNLKNYVSVDGGMTDNPRFALYKSRYTVMLANKANALADYSCTVAGRCCESGDIIGEDMLISKPDIGDTLAVFVTGAYNHSMASNYNCVPRPPIVMLDGGRDYVAVRRESFDDLSARDL